MSADALTFIEHAALTKRAVVLDLPNHQQLTAQPRRKNGDTFVQYVLTIARNGRLASSVIPRERALRLVLDWISA